MKKLFKLELVISKRKEKIRIALFFLGIYIGCWTYDTFYEQFLPLTTK